MTEKNNKKWCIYIHTNKINNKVYIGQTCMIPEKRWGKNGNKYLNLNKDGSYRHPAMAYALLKYPDWDNDWTHEIVAINLTKEEADNVEIELIAKYKSNCIKYQNPSFGYNMNDGGRGGNGTKLSDEAKRKISEAHKNLSEESRKKMSKSAKERCTDEWRLENSKIQSGTKRTQCSHKCSDDTKEKISSKNGKAVLQLTMDNFVIREFSSQTEAEKVTGIQQSSIWRCCNDKLKSAGGYKWRYADSNKTNKKHHRGSPVVQLSIDGEYIKTWNTVTEAEKTLGIVKNKISSCCNGVRKSTGGYKWMFKEDWDELQLTIQNELEGINELQAI